MITTKSKPFEKLLTEAVALSREAAKAPRYNDGRDERPSAAACLAIATANAGLTATQLAELDARIKEREFDHPWATRLIRSTYDGMIATKLEHRADIYPISENLHHRMDCSKEEFTNVKVEAASLNTNPLGLVAIAIRRAALEYPSAFGLCDDPTAREKQEREQREKMDELVESLAEAFSMADTSFELLNEATCVGTLHWRYVPGLRMNPARVHDSIRNLVAAMARGAQ
jgi:hypothetical protein